MKTQSRNFLSLYFLSALVVAGTISLLAGPALAGVLTFNFTGTIMDVTTPPPYGLSVNVGDPVTGSITYDTSLPPAYDTGSVAGYIQPPPSGMSMVVAGVTIQSQNYNSFQVLNNAYGVDNINGYFTPILVNGQLESDFGDSIGFGFADTSQTVFSSTALPETLDVNSFNSRGGGISAGSDSVFYSVSFSIDTLEGGVEILPVKIDIKPGSCPNPITLKDSGVMPIAIMGTADFDISQIDPASIRLSREGVNAEVAPLRWSYDDVGIPFEGELCACARALHHDRITDLVLKFSAPAIINVLKLAEVVNQTIPLTITGNLKPEFGGTPITGQDCLRILKK